MATYSSVATDIGWLLIAGLLPERETKEYQVKVNRCELTHTRSSCTKLSCWPQANRSSDVVLFEGHKLFEASFTRDHIAANSSIILIRVTLGLRRSGGKTSLKALLKLLASFGSSDVILIQEALFKEAYPTRSHRCFLKEAVPEHQ